MARFEDQIKAMFRRGESVQTVARWFLDQLIEHNPREKDLSPYELNFFNECRRAYRKWLRSRKVH